MKIQRLLKESVIIFGITLSTLFAGEGSNLISNGTFADGMNGWEGRHGAWELRAVETKTEGDKTFARLSADKPTTVQVVLPVDESWKNVTLSFESRRSDVVPGSLVHETFTAEINFKNAEGKNLLNWERTIFMREASEGWETVTKDYAVPEGAATMIVAIGNRAKEGAADYANLTVTAN